MDDEALYYVMDHYPLKALNHKSDEFEGVSIYKGEIPHDVDHHGMIRLNLRQHLLQRQKKNHMI